MTRLVLLERLKQIQQTPQFQKRDITTVSALLSTEALARHVEVCELAVDAPSRRDGRPEREERGSASGRALIQ